MGLLYLLNIIGALVLFLFGIKLLIEGIQNSTGRYFQRFIIYITRNKYNALLSGIISTSLLQSSSIVSIITISLSNARLISLSRSFSVIVGANIGTTITAWLVAFLGMSNLSLQTLALAILAISIPFFLSTRERNRNRAMVLISISIIVLSLNLLKTSLPELNHHPSILKILEFSSGFPFYIQGLFFLLIGMILTAIIQSSSISISLALFMVQLDFPIELGAYFILGANVGTTFSSQLAATVGNAYAKVTAHFHTIFNCIGCLLFFFTLPFIISFIKEFAPNFTNINEGILASFHTLFNCITAIFVFPLIPYLVTKLSKLYKLNKKKNKGELRYFNSQFDLSSEVYMYEAQQELQQLAGVTRQTIASLGRLITESNPSKIKELSKRIETLEQEGDAIEKNLKQFYKNLSFYKSATSHSTKFFELLTISHHLESIGDIALQTVKIYHQRKKDKSYFTPELRIELMHLQDLVSQSSSLFIQNINENKTADIKSMETIEKSIDSRYEYAIQLLKDSAVKGEIKGLSIIYYKDIIKNYELIGDHFNMANIQLLETYE